MAACNILRALLPAAMLICTASAFSPLAPAPLLRRTGAQSRRGSIGGLSMQQKQSLPEEIGTIFDTIKKTPSKASEVGALPAFIELGEVATATDAYRVYAQGAVGAFLAACHVASPETLQAVGTFHIAVCLPIALASASSKGHQLGPAAAKTLLIGGLAAAKVVFARDDNQLTWPSTGGAVDGAGALKGEVAEVAKSEKKEVVKQAPNGVAAAGKAVEEDEPSSMELMQQLAKEYSRVAVLSHFTNLAVFFAVIYSVLMTMDMQAVINMLPEFVATRIDPNGGAVAVSYIIVKALSPVRLLLDVALIPKLAEALRPTPLAGFFGLDPDVEQA